MATNTLPMPDRNDEDNDEFEEEPGWLELYLVIVAGHPSGLPVTVLVKEEEFGDSEPSDHLRPYYTDAKVVGKVTIETDRFLPSVFYCEDYVHF